MPSMDKTPAVAQPVHNTKTTTILVTRALLLASQKTTAFVAIVSMLTVIAINAVLNPSNDRLLAYGFEMPTPAIDMIVNIGVVMLLVFLSLYAGATCIIVNLLVILFASSLWSLAFPLGGFVSAIVTIIAMLAALKLTRPLSATKVTRSSDTTYVKPSTDDKTQPEA